MQVLPTETSQWSNVVVHMIWNACELHTVVTASLASYFSVVGEELGVHLQAGAPRATCYT